MHTITINSKNEDLIKIVLFTMSILSCDIDIIYEAPKILAKKIFK